MKKWLSMLLVLILTLCIHVEAFAAGGQQDVSSVDLKMVYTLINDETTSPEETVTFKIEKVSVSDSSYTLDTMPMFASETVTMSLDAGKATAAGMTNSETLTLPTYKAVGVFTYKISMTAGTYAGVTYDTNPVYLKVTVIEQNRKVRVAAMRYGSENGSKTEGFKNTYTAGNLLIKKTVAGNMGDKDKYFKINVTLSGEQGKTYAEQYAVTGGTKIEDGSATSTSSSIRVGETKAFYLKDGETITISSLPYGVTYTVAEDDYEGDGYEASYEYSNNNELKQVNSPQETVTITNTKEIGVDTGINMDNLPYLLLLAFAVAGGIGFVVRRRKARAN